MSHYALIDNSNVVTQVIVGIDDGQEEHFADYFSLTCKRTSYNTHGGVHSAGRTPFRKNYAGIGYSYDEARDAFIPPKPYASWLLSETTCLWDPPTPMPTDGKNYHWDEDTESWEE